MHLSRRKTRMMLAAVPALWASSLALAQGDKNNGAPTLQEVVVTAQKTGAESAQSAPLTLQAIGQDEIANAQLQGFDDYSKLIAGLSSIDKGPDQSQIVIRGITAGRVSHAEPQNESTSGLYIDEAPVADNGFNPDLDLFDVNRIEVLKGPQGTLFGAGAESGAIRIITNDVNLRNVAAAADVTGSTIDGGGTGYSGHGMVNVPLGHTLGLRAVAYYNRDGGYIKNLYGQGDSDINTYSTAGARLEGLLKPTDTFDVKGSFIYQRLAEDGRPQMLVPGNPLNTPTEPAAGSTPAYPLIGPGETASMFDVNRDYQVVKFGPDPFHDSFALSNLLIEDDLGSGMRLVSSTSFQNREIHNTLDDTYRTRIAFGTGTLDGVTPLTSTAFVNDTTLNDLAQEIRISQKLDSGLTWVGGLYYEHHDIRFQQSDVTAGLDGGLGLTGPQYTAATGAQPNSLFDGDEGDAQQQYAVFGEATIPLARHWDFVAGLRWFHYKQDSSLVYAGLAQGELDHKTGTVAESGTNPKAQITFHATRDAMLYLSASRGFRLGGITEPVPVGSGPFASDCARDLAQVGLNAVPSTFKSDHLWSYELGAKTAWLERRLTLNVSVFDVEWSDIQSNIFLPCGFITVINAGHVRSRGAEAELNWAVTRGLTLSASTAYTNAKLTEKALAFAAQVGDRVPNVPHINGSAAAEYRWLVGTGKSVYMRADVAYVGDSFTEFNSLSTALRVPSSTSIDGSLGMDIGSWEVSVYGKNLANRLIVTGVDTDREVPETYSVAPPRTLGVEARYDY